MPPWLLCFAPLLCLNAGAAAAETVNGEQIYKAKCSRCHGPQGEGTKKVKRRLEGDRSVTQLADVIRKTMPESAPGSLSEKEAQTVMRSVHRVARVLRERLGLIGLNVTQANGAAAWQEIFHYHVHLIPRYGDDAYRPPWRSTSPSEEQLREVQKVIRGE